MSTPNDGGPAFPCPETENVARHDGMSLRAYLAGKALQGYLADSIVEMYPKDMYPKDMAEACLKHADALIKELGQEQKAEDKLLYRKRHLESVIGAALETLRLDDQWTPRRAQVEAMLSKAIGGE